MTATERVRRMLDERGVEWHDTKIGKGFITVYEHDDITWIVTEHSSGRLSVKGCVKPTQGHYDGMTPEQAIAATLGDTDATRERQGDAGTCRPCPFCGSNAETVHTLKVVPHEPWWIRCPSCGVTTPKYSSKTDAIAAWNRRTQQAIEASLGMES